MVNASFRPGHAKHAMHASSNNEEGGTLSMAAVISPGEHTAAFIAGRCGPTVSVAYGVRRLDPQFG